jgi:hypothetical protein
VATCLVDERLAIVADLAEQVHRFADVFSAFGVSWFISPGLAVS